MIFYQINTTAVTTDQLKDAIFRGSRDPKIHYFNFLTFPRSKSIDDVFALVESKRKTLSNPNLHNFMCLELLHDSSTDMKTLITSAEHAADGINYYFENDLYIAVLIYDDEDNCCHTCIIFSDIEKSLYASSSARVSTENLNDILYEALPEYNLGHVFYKILYQFNHEEKKELTYDGVIHLQCPILDFITSKP